MSIRQHATAFMVLACFLISLVVIADSALSNARESRAKAFVSLHSLEACSDDDPKILDLVIQAELTVSYYRDQLQKLKAECEVRTDQPEGAEVLTSSSRGGRAEGRSPL